MNLQTQDVYTRVDVKEKLPERLNRVIVRTNYNQEYITSRGPKGAWNKHPFVYDDENPTHWLEKRSGVIILTPEELEKIRRNDYASGVDWALNTGEKGGGQYEKYLSEYLNEPLNHLPDTGNMV